MKRKVVEKNSLCLVGRDDLSDISDSEDSYEVKVSEIERQLKQLDEKTHPEYLKAKRKVESWYTDEKQRVQILHDHRLETIYREFSKEYEACDRDCELEKRRIQDYLTSLCEELKRRLEHDKRNIELTPSGDILDFKPAVTRKLRRRAGTDVPTATATSFMHWGDLLLCGSTWPLNAVSCKTTLPSLDTTQLNDVKSPVADGLSNNGDSAPGPSVELSDSIKVSATDTTGSTVTGPATTSSGSITTGSTSTTKSNLFGSLGVNLFDGGLLAHLLTSINGAGGYGGIGSGGSVFGFAGSVITQSAGNPNVLFNPAVSGVPVAGALSSLLHGPSASTAMAAGLLLPSAGSLVASVGAGISTTGSSAPTPLTTATGKKRRQHNAAPTAQLNLLLPENDIYADLTIIRRACAKLSASSNATTNSTTTSSAGSARKHHHHSVVGTHTGQTPHSPTHGTEGSNWIASGQSHRTDGRTAGSTVSSPNPTGFGCATFDPGTSSGSRAQSGGPLASPGSTLSVWIDDGRLYCGQKCYQYGASVILEGRDGANQRCSGTITAIGAQDVAIRRSSDHGICRVTVQQLKQGRYTLWPAKTA